MKKISVLIPIYNEQDSLPRLFERVGTLMDSNIGYEWEIMLVNDGSTDKSLEIAAIQHQKDARFRILDLSRNYGKEIAMMAGLDYVTGDCAVIMDADLQHPPEFIPNMIAEWEDGWDDVYGKREDRGKESWIRKKLSLTYYKLLQKQTRIDILQNVGDFRLLDRQCIEALKELREVHRYTKGMFCYIGFRKKGVDIRTDDRLDGDSKWNFGNLISLAVEGITSYTSAPLRIATIAGLTVSFASFLYMVVVVVRTLIYGDPVPGFPSLIIVILLLGGIQLIALGIIGEYIGRIFDEAKQRPAYFVRTIDGERVISSHTT